MYFILSSSILDTTTGNGILFLRLYTTVIVIMFVGYQPPLELLTQILSQGGVYDRERQQFQEMNEAIVLAAATLPSCPGK